MNIVAEQAAERVVAKLRESGCPVDGCAERGSLETVVFGKTEKNIVGLDQRVADVEREIKQLRDTQLELAASNTWMRRLFFSTVAVAIISLLGNLVQAGVFNR